VAKKRDSSGGIALVISLIWAFMPVPVAAAIRLRSRRKRTLAEATDNPETVEEDPS
jgi:hypothetical protein